MIPRAKQKARHTWEMNWGPWSETMSAGMPCMRKTWDTMSSAVSLAEGSPGSATKWAVGPRKTGERQVAKQSRPGLVGCLAACTGGTCGDERPGVSIHGRPPEPVVQEGQGAVDPGMTSQPRQMTPLQNVQTNCIWNEQPTGRTSPRIGLVSLGLGHQGLDFPDQRGHYAGGR